MSNDLVPVEGTQRTWARSAIPPAGRDLGDRAWEAEVYLWSTHRTLRMVYAPIVYVDRRGRASGDRWDFNPPIYCTPQPGMAQQQAALSQADANAVAIQSSQHPYGTWHEPYYRPGLLGPGSLFGGLF